MTEFRFVGVHAESLNGGRMLEPGDFTGTLDPKDDVVARLVEDGSLVEVPNGTYKKVNKVAAPSSSASDDNSNEESTA